MSHGPETLKELTENLSTTFQEHFKRNHKTLTTSNAARYLSEQCFNESDSFRDKMSQFNLDDDAFTFTDFGDELQSKQDTATTGTKRSGDALDGPTPKKRKLDYNESDDDDIELENDDDNKQDEDIDMLSADDNEDSNNKKNKRKKLKLPEKFKDDEDFRDLEAPPNVPSKASIFFDPVAHCKINLDEESTIHMNTKHYLNTYEIIHDNEVDINQEEIQYINKAELDKFLQQRAINNGFTMQKEVSAVLCLALQDHLKNMMDEMNKWRKRRNDRKVHHEDERYKIKYNELDTQKWIDSMNEKYSVKQQIFEAKDEIEALETEKTDLDFKKMTGILTEEETKRRDKLDGLIRRVRDKQRRNDKLKAEFADSSLKALGGDFTFNFGGDRNKNNKNKGRQLASDKFYVIDVINMMENHQKYNQQHLKQLSKLYMKNV